jgi:hypothetical protein
LFIFYTPFKIVNENSPPQAAGYLKTWNAPRGRVLNPSFAIKLLGNYGYFSTKCKHKLKDNIPLL